MKRNSIYKKALVLVAVLALALILLVGCGKTKTPDDPNLNQFVKPDTGNQQQSTTVKTSLSGTAARHMLLTSIVNAKTPDNARYITFSLAPYVYVEKEGKTDKYTVRIKGSIDTEDSDKSVMTFEVIKESADLNTVVLGIYALNGDMYIDFNDYASGKAVHRYYVSDSDISYVVGVFKQILNQLQLEEFFKEYDLGSLFGDSGVGSLISQILGTSNSDKLTIFNLLLSLIADNGCYSVTNADGSIDLVMPTKLNALFTNSALMEQLGNIVKDALKNQSDIIKGVVNLLVGDILSGQKTLNTTLVANISNNRFQKMALNVISSKGNIDKTVELGVAELSKSDNFAKEVKDGMPTLVKADRKNYSFTTLSADIDVELNVAEQKYSVKNIDDALGGAIAKALESITGTAIYNNNDAVQILSPLKISLQLKLRAEINLKNNSKSRAVIELNGKDKNGNPRTYLGLYYIGADKAIYADMSGLGGGKAMIPNVDLNQILKDLIASKIPEIPSIMDLIKGNGSGASDGDVLNEGLLSAVQTVMDKGELVVTHYGFASEDNESAAVEETANLDIMALLACVNIVMGTDTPITVERISADLTKDVIAGLMGKLGLKLPVENIHLAIYQTREDYPQGEEGWKIEIASNMASNERGQIADLSLGVFLNYGNPDPTLNAYIAGKNLKSVKDGGEFVDAGKLKYDGTTLDFDLWASVGLDIDLSFDVSKGSVLDLSPLGKMLYGLALKVQSPDGVDVDLNLKINANVNVMKLVNAIKNNTGVKDILDAIDARIDVHANAGEKALDAVLLLEKGVLYLYSADGELRNYKINILDALGGNFKLFGKDTSAGSTALASGDGDNTEGTPDGEQKPEDKAEFDILGLLVANLAGITISNERLEVAIANTLLSGLLKGLGVDTKVVDKLNFTNNDTGISLEYDGLNLSKLYLKANVGIQQGESANMALGLGLGHIYLSVGTRDLKTLGVDVTKAEYHDLLNGGNIFLGLGAEIDVFLDKDVYELEEIVGALVADFAIGTKINVQDVIQGGLRLNVVADVDISSAPKSNDTRLLIELRKVSDNSVFLGLYYDQKTTTLYLNTVNGTIIQPVALKFDLIALLDNLINKKGDGTASADIDLSELNPIILLGNKGVQIKVMTGVMKLLVGVLVGDMNDYIAYNPGGQSYKYYAYNATTDYTILENAYPKENSVKDKDLYQRNVDKYKYTYDSENSENSENPFTLDNGYVGDDFFVRAKTIVKEEDGEEVKEQTYFYVLKEQAVAQGIDKHCQKNADGTLKEFVNSGRKFTLIDASNKDAYASAPKYLQSEYKRADTLMFDMDKDAIDFKKGFIKAYNKTSGFTTYVKIDASNQDVALYELFTNGYTMKRVFGENGNPTGDTTEMKLKLPELGASIVIGQINDGDVSITGKDDKFSGIGIGVFIMRNGATEPFSFVKIAEGETYDGTRYNLVDGKYVKAENGEYKKVNHTVANLGIKLGNIQLSEKKFKNEYGKTFEEYIDSLSDEKNFENSYKFEKIAEDEVYTGTRYNLVDGEYVKAENGEYKKVNTVVADKIEDLTVYVNVEAAIELGADQTTGETKWEIGGLLSGLLKGNENVSNELAEFLKKLLIKFKVAEEIRDVIGLRISGNIQLGALMGGGDAKNIIANLLKTADLAVEITDKAPWDKSAEQVVGLYVTNKTVYINVNGKKTVTNTKLKIGVDQILGMIKGGSGSATASADLGVDGILKVINDIVKEISIYRNDTESGMTITLGKNMIGAILKVVADIEGVDLQLVEENSKIEFNTKVTEDNPYILGVSVGINPIILGVKLGGLQIGLAKNDNVLKNLKGKEGEYKGLDELDQISLDVEIGLDLGLKQGMFPIGTLLSGILQATGTDLEFPLNLDVQKAIDLDLRVRVAGNLNLKDFGKSDIMLQVRNDATGKEKTILGLYFTTDANGNPCLYVETQFMSQSAPVKSKIENFDLIGSLLGKTVEGVVKVLGGKVDGSGSALASDDSETPAVNEAEILLELASKSLDVKIAEETVKGLLKAFIGKDAVGEDILEIINNLGLSASLSVDLKDENKPLLEVVATCSYLNLGVLVDTVKLSTNNLDIFGEMFKDEAEWTKAKEGAKSALGVQFGVAIDYDLSNGKHSLDAILKNVASSIIEKDAKMATVGSILKALTADAIIKNTRGTIGINVVLNVLSGGLSDNLIPAATALYNFVMSKIGGQSESTDGQNILDILNSIEALIKVDLNGNPIFVSIQKGVVHISLSAVGGANYSASLENIIKQIKPGTGSSALASDDGNGNGNGNENQKKEPDFVLINKILQNLLSSTSIGESGLDVALAPKVLQFLLTEIVAGKISETFGFNEDVLAMFKLSDPYVKYSTETVGKSIDDLLYMEKVDVRYVNFNETFKSQQGKEILFFDTTETDVTKAYKTLYRQSPNGSNVFVLYTGGKVEKLYYKSGDTYVEITTAPAELKKFVKYEHTSYLAVYNSKDKETRSLVSAKGYDGTATVYDANGNEVQKGNLFIKQDHSGIKWSKDKGIGIDLIFDNPNTAKAPDFSIHLGLDATLVMKGEAIEVEPYALKKKGATPLKDIQEIEGYYNEGTALVEIPVAEVYTGTRYDKDGTANANGKYRKELVPGTEADHTLVKIKNVFSEVPENVTSEKIYLSMELGLKLSGTKGTNDSILDFIGGIIDISNRTGNIEYYPILENEVYEGQKYSATGAPKFKLDANGTFKRGAYYLAEKDYVGTKFTKNINEGVITFKVDANGLYKFVDGDSAKTYFLILPEEKETYPADKKYKVDGNGFVTDDAGTFKAGKYVVTGRDYEGVKFRLDDRTKDKVGEEKEYLLYNADIALYKQGNYYKLNKGEEYNGVKFKKLADGTFEIDNENGEYKFVAEEGAYYPVLENDGYTGKLYRVSEASTAENTIYIEDVIYKFTPAFSGKDLTELNKVAKLLVSIGAFEDEARIRLTVGADIAELIKALSDTKNIDIPALISKIELAIESLDTKGQVKGGIYLYNSNLYIKYIDSERDIFAMPMGDIIGALAKASADGERQPFEAAMLQLWVGEFSKLNGAYTTGVAVKATTTLVERLLEVLLGFDEGTISLSALGGVDLAVTIETASPIFPENADGNVYYKKAYKFVEITDENYNGVKYIKLANGEYVEVEKAEAGATLYKRVALEDTEVVYENINGLPDGWLLSECEGYDSAYAEALTTRYTKVGEVYEELKFGFDFDSFGIGIGLKIGHIGFNLNIGKIDLGFVDDNRIIVPEDVKKQIVPEEAEIDLSMEVNIGVLVNDKHNAGGGFDLGGFIDNLGVLSGVNLGKEWLKLKVPDGGAELELTLRVALSLNITNLDHSVAAVEIVGRIKEGGKVIGDEKVLVGVYYKDGNALVKLEGLGFDNVRVSGLKLSSLLGASNGIELIKKLKGGGNGASTALASELGFTVADNKDKLSAVALVFDHNRIAVEVGTLFINGLLDIAALGLDNNTKAMLQKLDLQALVEVNYGDKFDKIADGEAYTGTRYFYDETTHEYYIDENGEYKRSSNISLKLNAEAADLIGISVAIENIKIGNTGVKETVAKEKIEDYAELIELLIDSSTNKIVGFEPKLEALTLSLDIDLGALFTDGMWMGRTDEGVDATTGKPIITNVSSVGAVGSGNMGIRASVKLELALAAILNKLEEGFDSSDIFKAIEEILPLVKAQISIYAQSDGDELVGIYVADGNVYLMLDGLGMPNVKVTGEFLMKVIRTATGSSTALASGDATASNAVASADANQIIGILKKLIAGVELGGKALKVAFQNDYFATLIDTMFSLLLNKPEFKYYGKVLPEPNSTDVAFSGLTVNLGNLGENYEPIWRKEGKYYTDSSCNEEFRYYGMVFNKNPQTQHIELYSEKEFVQQYVEGYAGMTAEELENAIKGKTTFHRSTRKGLVELDLDAYATHLKLAVNFPKIGAKKDLITSPNVGGVVFSDAEEVNGLALGIKGQIKINKQEGIALANILSGVVGDLETKLVIEDDIDIRFAIEAKAGIKYDLEDKTFGLSAIDLRVSLSRYYDPNNIVPLATLTYISSEGALYVDVSHFFKKQNEGNNKNLGMLKITGVNILDILNGLITGAGSSATVALGSADGSAWADEARTYIYYEANSMNSVAPDRYAQIHTLTDTDEVKKVYKNYTGEIVDYKTKDGRTLYVRDRDNKVTGYSVLSAENAEKFAFKAKYTHEVVTEFEKLNNLYIVDGIEYVIDANGTYKRGAYEIAEEGYTGTKFAMEADGTFKVDANGTYKFVADASATTYYPILDGETYEGDKYQIADKYVRIADDTADFTNTKLYKKLIKYVEITAGETVPESDRYNLVDGKYVQANDGKYKAVDKYVEVANGSASYIMEYNPKTCKYDFNVYDKDKPSHNAPKLYYFDGSKYVEGVVAGKTSYVKVPVYSISAVWADLSKYGIGDNVAGYDVKSNAKVNITGKAMLGLIGGLMDKGELEDILDALLVSIHATKDPFIFGLDIGILDVYNNHQLALNIGLNIFGFDFEKREGAGNTDGSYLEFLDAENTISFLPENADKYRQFADIDLDRILGAAEIMDVLIDSLDFGRSGKIFLNVSLDVDSFANDTGDNIVPWERYFAGLLGLNKDSAKVLYQVLFPKEELDGYGNFSIDIAAAIDVKNLLGGLLSGTGLNLEGTELRLTINMDTMLFAEDLREKNSKIVITAIGEADGILSVYIDNSNYRNKGKHVAKIDLNAILAGSSTSAQASASANTGLIPENIFGVLNALLGEVRLGDGRIYVGLRDNFIGELLNVLLGTSITEEQSLVKGGVYIDLRNLEVGLEMILGNDDHTSDEDRDFYIGLRVGGIHLSAPDGFDTTANTFIKQEDRVDFVNIRKLKLDINFEAEWYYESSKQSGGFDISAFIDILETILKKELFPDKLVQFIVKEDEIDAVYTLALNAHIDLADFNNMKVAIEIYKATSTEPRDLKVGIYLDGQSLYADLSGWGLPKLKLAGLNLGDTINNALTPILDKYLIGDGTRRDASTSALASSYIDTYDKDFIEYSEFVEAENGKYVLIYTESQYGNFVKVGEKYVRYSAKKHEGLTRYSRKVETYDATHGTDATRYNVSKGAFRTSWGKALFPVEYEESATGEFVFIDGKYVKYDSSNPAHLGATRYKEISGGKPYVSLVLANNHFGFGINADLLNSLLETITGALGLDIQLPNFGDAVMLFDSRKDINGDGMNDTQFNLVVQIDEHAYFGLRSSDFEISGNNPNSNDAERKYNDRVASHSTEFAVAYDIASGEIGLENLALGFNVEIRQICVDDGVSEFEQYLNVLLKSLLGIENFKLNLPKDDTIGCDIDLRVALNLKKLVSALQGGTDDWWSDIELYLNLKPFGYGSLVTLYKQKGDADVYADLSGLSLFKVKIIGLQSLIGGLVSGTTSALASGDGTLRAPVAPSDKAILTVIPGKTGFKIEIGWGFIEGLLSSLLGDKLHFGEGGQCSDLYVRKISGYNDTEVNVTYDECNPFGMILGDFGDKGNLTENIPNAVSNSTISAFNELSKLFANSLAKFGIPTDGNVYNRIFAETDKEAWDQYTAFYNKAMGIYDSAFAKIARNLKKSAIVGIKDVIEEDGTLIRTPYTIGFGENTEGVDYQEVIARLFGFKSAVAFKNAIINLKSLYEDYMKDPVNKALENGCFNTAYQIEEFSGKSFVFPIVVKNGITTPILTYVIIDNNGSVSVWVSDIGETMKATNFNAEHTTGSAVNNRLFGKYALFVTGMNLVGYKIITIGEGATATVIPLPKLNNERALTLSINHPSKVNGRDLELELALGFNNNDDSSIGIKIRNIVITDGAKDSSDYIRYGATKGAINTSGTNVLDAITGTNAHSFSGLILNDAKGLSLINILTAVVKGIDPAISIEWYKNTQHYYNVNSQEGAGERYTSIQLSRTDASTKHLSGNVKTYAGKFQAIVKSYDKKGASNPREIGAWLFNNQLYLDISKVLDIVLGLNAVRKMKIADLDILGLLGGLGSASSTALASDDTTTEKSLKDTISGFIKGVEVNWWNNQSVEGRDKDDRNISTIRVDLNADGLNEALAGLYYMLYGMYDKNAPAADTLPKDVLQNHVYKNRGEKFTGSDNKEYTSYGAHNWCVYYLQTFAAETIGTLKNALKPGGTFGNVLRDIIGGLLPLPKLDATKSNYAEIVIDKSRLAGGKGVLKEIALSINKERTEASGNTFKRVTCGQNSAEIVIKFDDNVTLRSVSGVRNYDNGSAINQDSGTTIVVENPFDPVELTSASLNSNPALLKRVTADFHGISEYDSKSQKENVPDKDKGYAELGGTPIVWNTSTAVLAPGAESYIWGYALNYKVQKVKVRVSDSAGFLKLFGYFKADGTTFVETNKIIVDPTKDPTGDDNVTAGLPRIIAIMRKDGELQVLSRDFDKDKPATVKINGVDYTVDGKFNWIDEDTVEEGATMEKAFWYQVGYSSRIQKTIKVKYNNVSVVSGSLPTEGVYDILNGGTAFDFTNEKHLDIIGNLGLPSIKANSKFTDNNATGTISYIGVDGSTYTFTKGTAPTDETELAEWNKHKLGLKGTFVRTFNDKTLQTGTYTYVPAESKAEGLLDSLGGLFGGSDANADSGSYALTVDSGYTWLDKITVTLKTGKTTTVDVLEWKYDDFKYDMNNPQNGASGNIVAVINKYKITRTTGDLATTKLVNSKQEIKIPVSIAQETLSALAGGNLNFNQYKDMFVLSSTGDYVLETREVFVPFEEKNKAHEGLDKFALVNGKYVAEGDASVAEDNKARFVKQEVTGYVYDKYTGTAGENRYAINIFDAEELYVKVRRSRITFETQLFTVKDFAFYTDTLNMTDADQTPVNMFVVPELGVKTERNITVQALYKVNDAYEQVFDIKVVVTPKVATKVVLLIDNTQVIDRAYLETAKVAVYYKDGSVKEGLAKDLIRLSDDELDTVAYAKDKLGITNGTVSVFKKGKYVEIKAGEVYEGKTYNRNGDVFTEAEEGTTGTYKFVEDETFVQNGVTFEIRVFSKN